MKDTTTTSIYDVAVIGGGLIGCFAARALSAYKVNACVLEAREDVCTGISKANSAIVYAGYDMKPKSLKARMVVRANREFANLCSELGVAFSRCGSLMVAFDPEAYQKICAKYEQGVQNGVSSMHLVKGDEACDIEPALAHGALGALWSQSVGTVMPWELCIAAAENAAAHDVAFRFGTEVASITRGAKYYTLEASNGAVIHARTVINCAGIHADKIARLAGFSRVCIAASKAEYLVYDSLSSRQLSHVIFYESSEKGKKATAIPCVDGHVIIGGTKTKADSIYDTAVTAAGIRSIKNDVKKILPGFADARVIASFAGLRPNPRWVENEADIDAYQNIPFGDGTFVPGKSIQDFCIEYDTSHPDFVSLVGIKTPGLTCAWELGKYVTALVLSCLDNVEKNEEFDPTRRASLRTEMRESASLRLEVSERASLRADADGCTSKPADDALVCTCEGISKQAILSAIARGARDIDGVKRRTGAHMGNCQGSRCEAIIARIISDELGIPLSEVCKNEAGSQLYLPKKRG